MNKQDKEVDKAIREKFGTSKTSDEIFSDRQYWATVPVDEEGEPHENPRSNPDVLPASAGKWFFEPTDEQQTRLDAIAITKLTKQERRAVELYSEGLTYEMVGRLMALSENGVKSALRRARTKVTKKLSIKMRASGQ